MLIPRCWLLVNKVGKEAKRFNEVKKGDQVVLRITEALLIAVTKP